MNADRIRRHKVVLPSDQNYEKKLSYEISNGQTCYLIKTYINFLNQKLN